MLTAQKNLQRKEKETNQKKNRAAKRRIPGVFSLLFLAQRRLNGDGATGE